MFAAECGGSQCLAMAMAYASLCVSSVPVRACLARGKSGGYPHGDVPQSHG